MYYTEDEVVKKWKYLRTQYTDELKKEKCLKSGMAGDDVYVSKWRYMTELSFLSAHVCLRNKTISNLSAAKVRCKVTELLRKSKLKHYNKDNMVQGLKQLAKTLCATHCQSYFSSGINFSFSFYIILR